MTDDDGPCPLVGIPCLERGCHHWISGICTWQDRLPRAPRVRRAPKAPRGMQGQKVRELAE